MFCDRGADANTTSASGQSPLVYSALKGYDEICMYLSLRVDDIDQEDKYTHKNTLTIYVLNEDLERVQQLIMRGANVNYSNKQDGWTPLHFAIENGCSSKMVKFLLK